MTYTLDLDPWAEAGWNDFSIQIDDTLQSGMTHGGSADGERMPEPHQRMEDAAREGRLCASSTPSRR